MRGLLFIICLAVAGGCTTITAPIISTTSPPPNIPGYFWPQANKTYRYYDSIASAASSGSVLLTISVGGNEYSISELDVAHSLDTSAALFTANISPDNVSLGSLSNKTILALPESSFLVSDTAIGNRYSLLKITAISGVNGTLYAASDQGFFVYDAASGTFLRQDKGSVFPKTISMLVGREGYSGIFYAASRTEGIWRTTDGGETWMDFSPSPRAKSTSALLIDPYSTSLFAATDTGMYQRAGMQWNSVAVSVLPKKITALAISPPTLGSNNQEVFLGTDSGTVVHYSCSLDYNSLEYGSSSRINELKVSKFPINCLEYQDGDIIAGTVEGLFRMSVSDGSGFYSMGIQDNIISLTVGNTAVLAGSATGNVWLVQGYQVNSPKSQIAINKRVKTIDFYGDTSYEEVALVDSLVYQAPVSFDAPLGQNWTPLYQNIDSISGWLPGSFILLKNGETSWPCGSILTTTGGIARGFVYTARFIQHADSLVLGKIAYHDVIVMRYAVEKNGTSGSASVSPPDADNSSVPEYLIYFQRGVGPVRIEKSQQGKPIEIRSLSSQ